MNTDLSAEFRLSSSSLPLTGLAFAGGLAREGASGTRLAVVTMAFGLGTALGPITAGVLVGSGVVVPFVVSAILGVAGLVLVYTQVYETIDRGTPSGEKAVVNGSN